MPTRYSKRGEIQQFQYELANEIKRDAPPIARGVFGDNRTHPDMATLSNAELDQMYLQAYLRNDRTFLMQEAQRDPTQFLEVTDRIGVEDPPVNAQGDPIPSQAQQEGVAQAFQQQAVQNAAQVVPPPPLPPPGAAAPAGIGGPAPAAAPMPAALPSPGVGPMTQMPLPVPSIPPGTL